MKYEESWISEIIDKFYMVQASDANFRFARKVLTRKNKTVKNPDDAISDSLVWQRQEVHRPGGLNHLQQSLLSPSGVWIEAELKRRGIKYWKEVPVPVPFPEKSSISIDFLLPDYGVALEPGGGQHLSPAGIQENTKREEFLWGTLEIKSIFIDGRKSEMGTLPGRVKTILDGLTPTTLPVKDLIENINRKAAREYMMKRKGMSEFLELDFTEKFDFLTRYQKKFPRI